MSEWWTYRLSSFLLFSPRTWFRLHELYNAEIWPAQIVGILCGLAIVVLARRGSIRSGPVVAVLLAACWLWVAWAFHFRRYATINFAATWFAAAFAVEALVLVVLGAARGRLAFDANDWRHPGIWLVAFALIVQPLVGLLAGRSLLQAEYFGVAPDPTATATLGVLLVARRRSPALMAIPLLWCAVSGAFAWMMRTPDMLVMPLIALVTIGVALARRRRDLRPA
jgi:hypothetical protein